MRDRAWRRKKSYSKARRKRVIDISRYPHQNLIVFDFKGTIGFYDNLHQYSKNKIHCSCPMCSPKTNNKKNKYVPSKNYKISELRKINSMMDDLNNLLEDDVQ